MSLSFSRTSQSSSETNTNDEGNNGDKRQEGEEEVKELQGAEVEGGGRRY